MRSDCISGYFLETHGWVASKTEKNTYERGSRKVFYSGTNWYFDGKEIEDSISKNKYLKTPIFNHSIIPQDESETKEYYSRMMENK